MEPFPLCNFDNRLKHKTSIFGNVTKNHKNLCFCINGNAEFLSILDLFADNVFYENVSLRKDSDFEESVQIYCGQQFANSIFTNKIISSMFALHINFYRQFNGLCDLWCCMALMDFSKSFFFENVKFVFYIFHENIYWSVWIVCHLYYCYSSVLATITYNQEKIWTFNEVCKSAAGSCYLFWCLTTRPYQACGHCIPNVTVVSTVCSIFTAVRLS